ncbi:hypothetical protein EGW08_018819 [Elysia chlorotica]|uniref:Asl1-like glycosyl hydrolase catalytic domain-containing protein n=1 Tax=Elysia chlorotica TaxID=188477 RepID=A0A3S1BRU6_ELYCH|nr:hypothetical protein EGW08_018819 [Elysia chlorotica]
MLKGEHVFLSGGNLPWINYAYDFGNNQWAGVKSRVENQMKYNSLRPPLSNRLWIHIQGETSPQFDNNGYVIATDMQGTLISDVQDMLNLAQRYDILVIPTLWNAAVDQDRSHRLDGLIVDTRKLTSYIQVVLTPLVRASNPDPCFDTTRLQNSGAGWAGKKYNFQQMLREIFFQTQGKLDFYQFHSYSWQGKFDNVSPFLHQWRDYGTGKPIVIGEFNRQDGGGRTMNQLFEYVYRHGYSGAWSWDLVSQGQDQRGGISHIRNYSGNGKIAIDI